MMAVSDAKQAEDFALVVLCAARYAPEVAERRMLLPWIKGVVEDIATEPADGTLDPCSARSI